MYTRGILHFRLRKVISTLINKYHSFNDRYLASESVCCLKEATQSEIESQHKRTHHKVDFRTKHLMWNRIEMVYWYGWMEKNYTSHSSAVLLPTFISIRSCSVSSVSNVHNSCSIDQNLYLFRDNFPFHLLLCFLCIGILFLYATKSFSIWLIFYNCSRIDTRFHTACRIRLLFVVLLSLVVVIQKQNSPDTWIDCETVNAHFSGSSLCVALLSVVFQNQLVNRNEIETFKIND